MNKYWISTIAAIALALPLSAALKPETMTAKIATVDPQQHLLIVDNQEGVPFDMVVTAKTRIMSGDRTLTLQDLTSDQGKPVTIRFVPEGRGDVAQSIHLAGE